MNKQAFFWILGIICVLGGILRLYQINNPIADWHSWRQADTAAVARNYLRFGMDLLRPKYDDLSNIQSGKDNPLGLRMVEFPIYQALAVGLYSIIPQISIEVALRGISILASIISIGAIGILGKKISSTLAGLGAAFFFAVLPFSVYYGRTVLPEPLMVCFSLISLTLAVMSVEKKLYTKYSMLLLSGLFAGLALLVKPFAIFLLFPLPYLFVLSLGINWRGACMSIVCGSIAVLPVVLWRYWIGQFPEGIASYTWLFNEGNIRFKGAWFYWLFAERLGKLILGYWGISFFVAGIIKKQHGKFHLLPLLLLSGMLLYFIIIARGNVQHDYYQILALPVLALFVGMGVHVFIRPPGGINRLFSSSMAIVIGLFSMAFSWYEIRGFYWINHPEIVEAGRAVDELVPQNAKVIAPYNGDTTFLYQTGRQGWPIGFEIEKKIAQGATHYVTVDPTDENGEMKDLASRYTVLIRNEKFAIIDLTRVK
jgi:hypothetical protein